MRRRKAVLKVCYLLVVTTVVFAVEAVPVTRPFAWAVIPALLTLQLVMLIASRVCFAHAMRPIWRLKWLCVFLLAMYAFLPPEGPSAPGTVVEWPLSQLGWTISVNLSGLLQAALMCLQIVTMLLATAVVRLTGSGRDLIEGLRAFQLPPLFVHALDRTLDLMGAGPGGGNRRGGSGGRSRPGLMPLFKQVGTGDFSGFAETIRSNIGRAGGQGAGGDRLGHDVTIVTGIGLCMASLKMLKILPGLPFAPGHKTFLLFPLYVLASRLTHSRWGATAAGSIMGVIGLLQGDGRFGALEIFKHIVPGVVIDLGEPLVHRLPWRIVGYCALGLVAAVARTATEFMVVLLLGARAEIYLFPAVKLLPNLIAGGLSGFVTLFVLRVFEASISPDGPSPRPDPADEPVLGLQPPGDVIGSSGSERGDGGSGRGGSSRRGIGRASCDLPE